MHRVTQQLLQGRRMIGMPAWRWLTQHPLMRRANEELFHAPLESILHPSRKRLQWLGAASLIGHPLFFWIWAIWLPQPFESLAARCAMALLGGLLMLEPLAGQPGSTRTQHAFNIICFIQLPLFFSWMYAMNGDDTVWLASVASMILIYFHLTDWRIAAIGSVGGFLLGTALAAGQSPLAPTAANAVHLVVLGFAWVSGLLLGFSGANLRRERLTQSLATIGIMAHELRTPLSTAALIAEAVQAEARRPGEGARSSQLEKLAHRLQTLTRSMNHQIDLQITNARLLQLPRYQDVIDAQELLILGVAGYPFRSSRERDCVEIVSHGNFRFRGSRVLFVKVLDNLLKNALFSLQRASSVLKPGDLRIEIGFRGDEGRITVTDRGIGIEPAMQQRIFEPFFSTDRGTGHGLGLAFCRQVVLASGGDIRVRSEVAQGAQFIITLPVAKPVAARQNRGS